MSAVLAAILKVVADFLLGLVSNLKRDRDLQEKGRAEGEADLNRAIAEASDAQASNNAVDRGGASDVLDRLRSRLEKARDP